MAVGVEVFLDDNVLVWSDFKNFLEVVVIDLEKTFED